MIDVDLIHQCADPRLEVAVVQQFVAEMNAPDHLTIRVFQGDKMILVPAPKSAEEAVKLKYILLAIAEAESLTVNDEQIQQRIAQMAAASRRDPKKLREDLLKDNGQGYLRLKERLLMDLALETVMQTATIQAA